MTCPKLYSQSLAGPPDLTALAVHSGSLPWTAARPIFQTAWLPVPLLAVMHSVDLSSTLRG